LQELIRVHYEFGVRIRTEFVEIESLALAIG